MRIKRIKRLHPPADIPVPQQYNSIAVPVDIGHVLVFSFFQPGSLGNSRHRTVTSRVVDTKYILFGSGLKPFHTVK